MSEPQQFVVVLTDPENATVPPRAIGPFDNWDVAQTFGQTLTGQWTAEGRTPPTVTVVHVEADYPGVVVGEL